MVYLPCKRTNNDITGDNPLAKSRGLSPFTGGGQEGNRPWYNDHKVSLTVTALISMLMSIQTVAEIRNNLSNICVPKAIQIRRDTGRDAQCV